MNRLVTIFRHTIAIFKNQHLTFSKRLSLFWTYIRVVANRFKIGHLPSSLTKNNHQKFFGSTIFFDQFEDFYWTFVAVFIENEYYFATKNKTPFIIDCGGNIGLTAVYFKWLYPEAKVLIFEPLPLNVEILAKNIKGLSNVTCIPHAIGKERGTLQLYGGGRAATIHKDFIEEKKQISVAERDQTSVIQVEKLSDHINNPVDYLKLDIEGTEGEVIEDLAVSGKINSIDQLCMEYHHYSVKENRLSEIVRHLENGNFDVSFSGNGSLPEWQYYNFMLRAKKRAS